MCVAGSHTDRKLNSAGTNINEKTYWNEKTLFVWAQGIQDVQNCSFRWSSRALLLVLKLMFAMLGMNLH